MSDKMRLGFEAWSAEHEFLGCFPAERSVSGKYKDFDLQCAWEAWQASRESLVIDLDAAAKALAESVDYPWEFMPEQGRTRMKANARMVIEAAGLKVKP